MREFFNADFRLNYGSPLSYSVTTSMKLQPNVGSDRSWVWTVLADYADDEPTPETLAIRFANAEST